MKTKYFIKCKLKKAAIEVDERILCTATMVDAGYSVFQNRLSASLASIFIGIDLLPNQLFGNYGVMLKTIFILLLLISGFFPYTKWCIWIENIKRELHINKRRFIIKTKSPPFKYIIDRHIRDDYSILEVTEKRKKAFKFNSEKEAMEVLNKIKYADISYVMEDEFGNKYNICDKCSQPNYCECRKEK